MPKTWLIIDSNQLGYRAFYKMGGLHYHGNPTGVAYGFIGTIHFLQREFPNAQFVFCFDYGKNIRYDLCPTYKAKRRQNKLEKKKEELKQLADMEGQLKLLRRKILKLIGFQNVFYQKGYEADDLIASVCREIPDEDEGVIVSSDEDMFQLLRKNIRIYRPNQRDVMTRKRFINSYKIKPKQWIDVKCIAGCSSDEIPGIKGVGQTTALKFIRGELPETNKKYAAITCKEGKKIIEANRKLVKLPIEGTMQCRLKPNDKLDGWKGAYKILGIRSMKDPNDG